MQSDVEKQPRHLNICQTRQNFPLDKMVWLVSTAARSNMLPSPVNWGVSHMALIWPRPVCCSTPTQCNRHSPHLDLNDSLCDHPASKAQLLKREACCHAKAKLAAPRASFSLCSLYIRGNWCLEGNVPQWSRQCWDWLLQVSGGFLAQDGADHSLKAARGEHGKTFPYRQQK